MHKSSRNVALLALALLACSVASAHTGTDTTAHQDGAFLQGLLHPLSGLDHMAAMLAVGFWSALSARRVWLAPMAFANMVLVGSLLGMSGLVLPLAEPAIAVSVLVLGLLVATRMQLAPLVGMVLAGGFAVFHGAVHGTPMLATSTWLVQLAGLLCTTVLLHMAGVGSAHLLRQHSAWWSRTIGASVAMLGAVLLVQMA